MTQATPPAHRPPRAEKIGLLTNGVRQRLLIRQVQLLRLLDTGHAPASLKQLLRNRPRMPRLPSTPIARELPDAAARTVRAAQGKVQRSWRRQITGAEDVRVRDHVRDKVGTKVRKVQARIEKAQDKAQQKIDKVRERMEEPIFVQMATPRPHLRARRATLLAGQA